MKLWKRFPVFLGCGWQTPGCPSVLSQLGTHVFMMACCGLGREVHEASRKPYRFVSLKKVCNSLEKFSTGKLFPVFTCVGIFVVTYSKTGGPMNSEGTLVVSLISE